MTAGQLMIDLAEELPKLLGSENECVYQADTIADLAKATGLDHKVLEATVDEYNTQCACGSDIEFFKPSEYMRPLEAGPYYAFEVFNGYFCTVGDVFLPAASPLGFNKVSVSCEQALGEESSNSPESFC